MDTKRSRPVFAALPQLIGYNIAGPAVEAVLMLHPTVAECGVVGTADAERGQIVKAFVVPASGCVASRELASDLQDRVERTLAPYKLPAGGRVPHRAAALPRTETGKLQRFVLRRLINPETTS